MVLYDTNESTKDNYDNNDKNDSNDNNDTTNAPYDNSFDKILSPSMSSMHNNG